MTGDVKQIYRAILSSRYDAQIKQLESTNSSLKLSVEICLGQSHTGDLICMPVEVKLSVPYGVLNGE